MFSVDCEWDCERGNVGGFVQRLEASDGSFVGSTGAIKFGRNLGTWVAVFRETSEAEGEQIKLLENPKRSLDYWKVPSPPHSPAALSCFVFTRHKKGFSRDNKFHLMASVFSISLTSLLFRLSLNVELKLLSRSRLWPY